MVEGVRWQRKKGRGCHGRDKIGKLILGVLTAGSLLLRSVFSLPLRTRAPL